MTNTRTREVESRWGWSRAAGRVLLSALALGATVTAVTSRAEAQRVVVGASQPQPVVRETTVIAESNDIYGPSAASALVLGGALMLTAGWVSSFAVGLHEGPQLFISDQELGRERQWYEDFRFTSFIPIAGPWIALSQKNTDFDDDYWGVWLVANGLIQAAGFTMMIAGVIAGAAHQSRVSRRRAIRVTQAAPELQVLPSVGVDHAALTLAGTF